VDADQANVFVSRFISVTEILQGLPQLEAKILSIGFIQRTAEIVDGDKPRTLRVRAVVDYFYSHAALLYHQNGMAGQSSPSVSFLAKNMVFKPVVNGIDHGTIAGQTNQGPVHVNVLRIRSGRLQVMDCRGKGSLAEICRNHNAQAGVSGGFFLYSETDIESPSSRFDPVGLFVCDGTVVNPPVFRRSALMVDEADRVSIAPMGLKGVRLVFSDHVIEIEAVNHPASMNQGAVAFNRAFGCQYPHHDAGVIAIVGRQVVSISDRRIPLAGFVVTLPTSAPLTDLVDIVLTKPIRCGIAGGPALLVDGKVAIDPQAEEFKHSAPPITFSRDETFDQNLLPRMAAGLMPSGDLLFVAVDGRNFDLAPGMTLAQTARLCRALGCSDAMNLDGGSSKRMVVAGSVVDLPSTDVVLNATSNGKVRKVQTAMLVHSSKN